MPKSSKKSQMSQMMSSHSLPSRKLSRLRSSSRRSSSMDRDTKLIIKFLIAFFFTIPLLISGIIVAAFGGGVLGLVDTQPSPQPGTGAGQGISIGFLVGGIVIIIIAIILNIILYRW